jgi:hypothetical protein
MRLRQVAFVANRLGPAVEDITSVLGIAVAYNDPGVGKYGLENAVMPIGDTFLEVVAPVKEGTTAGRLLEKRGGDGGYMVILQVDNISEARQRVTDLGVRVVDRWDGPGACYTHLHPRDVGGAILSLDSMYPRDRWEWAGPRWREHVRTNRTVTITGVELQANDPAAMAARCREVLGLPVSPADAGHVIALDGGFIRFVGAGDGRGEGVSGMDVAAADRDAIIVAAKARGLPVSGDIVELCGVHVRLT